MPPSQVFIDLVEVKLPTPVMSMSGVTMVPMRPIAEKAGCRLDWIAGKQQLEVLRPRENFQGMFVNLGKTVAYYARYEPEISDIVSGEEELPVAPVMVNNTLYVPVEFLAKGLGYTYDDSVDSNAIYLFFPEHTKKQQTRSRMWSACARPTGRNSLRQSSRLPLR